MPVNANILAQFAQPVRSVNDFMADYDQADARKQGLQRNALLLQESQAAMADRERARGEADALRNALMGLGAGATDDQRIQALKATGLPGGFSQADALQKAALDRRNIESQAVEREAKAKADQYGLTRKKLEHGVQWLQVAQTPQQAAQMFNDGVQKGYWGMQEAQQQAQGIPQDPAAFAQWKQQQLAQILQAEKLLPTVQTRNTGGSTDTLAINPLTGVPTVTGSVRNTQTPDNVASNARMAADNAASRALQMRGQNMVDARAREATGVQLSKPFEVTGPDGSPILVQQTKNGQIVPVQGFAPKGGNPSKVADAKEALALLDQGDSLIKGATGSTIGAGVDSLAQAFGVATPGSIKAQQLKALEGALIAKMPKMSGPQSDKDVMLYRQMAGLIGDDTVPYERKAAAMQTVRDIQERYAGMTPGSSRPPKPDAGGAFSDPGKEQRYQEWKRSQGQK